MACVQDHFHRSVCLGLGSLSSESVTPLGPRSDLSQSRSVLGLPDEPSSRDQQAAEALCMLVALRAWSGRWAQTRIKLTVQTDNRSTLALVAKMQPHSHQLGTIAREMALDVSELSYSPDVINHVPGIANKAADSLSRLYQPGQKVRFRLPGGFI